MSKLRAPNHFSCRRGKRVRILLKNGDTLILKFKEKESSRLTFFDHDPIESKDMVSFSIYKGACNENNQDSKKQLAL